MTRIEDLPYIPGARDTRFGVVTRLGWTWCLVCADKYPDGDGRDHPDCRDGERVHIYGGDLIGHDGVPVWHEMDRRCDCCKRDLTPDAIAQQRDHDEQQRAWSRIARDVTHETVNGQTFAFPLAIRCY